MLLINVYGFFFFMKLRGFIGFLSSIIYVCFRKVLLLYKFVIGG